MAMQYQSLTQDEMNLRIAAALRSREEEHFHYDLNRQNYEALLADPAIAALPAAWPAELEQYKKLNRDETIKAITDPPTLASVQALQFRDYIRGLLKAETLEMGRVEKYHGQLLAKLPKGQALAAILTAEKSQREAAQARG